MALYDYELHMVRRSEGNSIIAGLLEAGLLAEGDDDEVWLPVGGHGSWREHEWTAEALDRIGETLQIASIQLEPDFEREATGSFDKFTEWLVNCAATASLDVVFIPPGSDAPAAIRQLVAAEPLTSAVTLMYDQSLHVAHPLLFLGAAFRRLETNPRDIQFYRLMERAGIGALFVFADVESDDSFDILDPAPFQAAMLNQVRRAVALH